jgi:predicted RNA-binding Zn-ribbon protein involved in translation (DUF1610 family)
MPASKGESMDSDATSVGVVKCPWCAEEILAEAKKCKHCGEFLTGDSPDAVAEDAGPVADDETPEVEGKSGWKKAQEVATYGRRKKLSAVGDRTDHGLACPKCGGTQFTAKRSKAGKTLGIATLGVGGLIAPKSQVKCVACGTMFKRG